MLEDKSIGLILSGGGVRGMAHIGLIKAMREHQIEAKVVAGTSIGALVGALYANDNSVEDMLKFFKETPLFQYSFFAINKPGFIDTERYFNIFKHFFPENDFKNLKRPLFVVATDLLKGTEKVFYDGELIKPLLASAALPPVFSPVTIDGVLYADGGIMNNFPKEYVDHITDYTIGSNVSITVPLEKKDLRNSFQLTARVTSLMIHASNHEKMMECDLFIEPSELETIGVLDKKGIENAFNIGYEHGSRALERLLAKT
ncbi:patatin-like phospholipase family protein [Muricauda oceani]|uniref:Patatin-like phospholipase family protein n=1 Tax=Flagellimonas oceani TaxID=2698672 RepID=A0A6G7J6I2_9FLAO|nr:patatin-like phospholipase family protein [Allomuricauda oceani]MBW8242662.1 patatin-like phospholipase family protein [Allomuricauda oceani]QII46416.1 patatin-like phospholipase family protein [Allomuricauda oceani]